MCTIGVILKKTSNTKYISKSLVICPQHESELNITYNNEHVELNETARKIIAQIKITQKEELKKEILDEIHPDDESNHNETIYEDKTENECFKIENKLLKQLIAELEEKNALLKELLNKEKNSSNMNGKTYSDVIKSSKTDQKRIPKVFVKKIDKNQKCSTKDFVLHYLNKEKNIQTKRINYKNDENIVIDCMNEESAAAIQNILKVKAQNSFKIQKEQLNKPKIKILGIENFNNMKNEDLESDIAKRNLKDCKIRNSNFKILHVYTNKQKKNSKCNS